MRFTRRPTAADRYPTRPPLARTIARNARIRATPAARWIRAAVVREGTLSIVGLGALVAAAWHYGTVAGLVAAGVALLIIDGRIAP